MTFKSSGGQGDPCRVSCSFFTSVAVPWVFKIDGGSGVAGWIKDTLDSKIDGDD